MGIAHIAKRMAHFLKPLIIHFPATLFKTVKDKTRLAAVTKAFGSSAWFMQFEFVAEFVGWLVPLMQWGSGCECCEQELLANKKVSCFFTAKVKIMSILFAIKTDKQTRCFFHWISHFFTKISPKFH